ncbi:hypothetical protein D3C86_1243070 [compost metagenome]
MATASSGGVSNPQCATTPASSVPRAAPHTTGRPLASMPVSLDGMTRSAAPARCGNKWMSAVFSSAPRRSAGCRSRKTTRASPLHFSSSGARSGPCPQKMNHNRSSRLSRRATSASVCKPCLPPMFPEYSATMALSGMPSWARYPPSLAFGAIALTSIQLGNSTARSGSTPLASASSSMRFDMVETRSKRRISQRSARLTIARKPAPLSRPSSNAASTS